MVPPLRRQSDEICSGLVVAMKVFPQALLRFYSKESHFPANTRGRSRWHPIYASESSSFCRCSFENPNSAPTRPPGFGTGHSCAFFLKTSASTCVTRKSCFVFFSTRSSWIAFSPTTASGLGLRLRRGLPSAVRPFSAN